MLIVFGCLQRRLRVGRRHANVLVRLACIAVVTAVLAVGALGLALNSASIGEHCSWCSHFACIHLNWWECTAVAGVPRGGCSYLPLSSTTASLTCPQVSSNWMQPSPPCHRSKFLFPILKPVFLLRTVKLGCGPRNSAFYLHEQLSVIVKPE